MAKAKNKVVKVIDPDYIIQNDEFIKSLFSMVSTKSSFKVDKTLLDELDAYLDITASMKSKSKRIPYGVGGPEDLKVIGQLLSKTQSYRSRVREIDITALTINGALTDLRERGSLYVKDRYQKEMSEFKNAEQRNTFIDRIFQDIDKKSRLCDLIREKSEIILENLNDTHWTLKAVKEIAEDFIPDTLTKGYRGV